MTCRKKRPFVGERIGRILPRTTWADPEDQTDPQRSSGMNGWRAPASDRVRPCVIVGRCNLGEGGAAAGSSMVLATVLGISAGSVALTAGSGGRGSADDSGGGGA